MKNALFTLSIVLGLNVMLSAQNTFTRKDSLQGGLPVERTCYDVLRYDLNLTINPQEKVIVGYNDITFKATSLTSKIQLDLFPNLTIDSISCDHKKLNYKREYNAFFVEFREALTLNTEHKLRCYYSGKPTIAKKAPWDGGFVFSRDMNNKPWVSVACQGSGASLWFPCKDSQSDEPDNGASIKITAPSGLTAVSNGRFLGTADLHNGYSRWDWEVKNPINNYDINITLGDFAHIHDNYKGLDLDYYVLRENEDRARIQFEGVKPMLDCFQSKFGPYPFIEDGYKLIETPFLGMEHQSAIAYGNMYLKGYLGHDRSETGIGMTFDFIIIHESGHEWFGNSITSKDIADMWIHESFTTYSEAVYVECQLGYEKGQSYINGLKSKVINDGPIIGKYGVHNEGSGDMYAKGALMLNTIRHLVNNDEKWWAMLLKYTNTYRHQIIDTKTVIAFFNAETGMDLTKVFNQYLRYGTIPRLQYRINKGILECQWIAMENNFNMPVDVKIKGVKTRLQPTTKWKSTKHKIKNKEAIEVLTNDYYINVN